MDKIRFLCEKDSVLLREFSRLSLERAGTRSLLSAALSHFSAYLDANVEKEIHKDTLIIEEAAAAFETGLPACELDLEDLFEKTKRVDRAFLNKLMIPSFAISVRYSDIADVRIRRIWRIAMTVYKLLAAWRNEIPFADAVRTAYTREELRNIIVEILHLYGLETRMLGEAVRSPFPKVIAAYLETLFLAMEEAKDDLANEYTSKIYVVAA
jgi:hypothetical protein